MNQIKKEHILSAISEIDKEGIRNGRHSSTYDLVYEGELYPPKLVISIANRFATGDELDSATFAGGIGTEAFKLLDKFGFKIVPKKDKIQDLISNYIKHIQKTELKDELYKWELVNSYKGRPNLEAVDFLGELKSIKYSNLIYNMVIPVISHLISAKPNEIRSLFIMLFDETISLSKRIKDFNEQTLLLYRSLGETLSHHQDERTMSTYLTFYNPDKYVFYKNSFYGKLCILLGVKPAKKNEKYVHYLTLIDQLIEDYIKDNVELIDLVKQYVPQYDGKNHLILVQDILFQMLDKEANQTVNYKETYSQFLDTLYKENSGTKSSYINAVEILSNILEYDIFKENNVLKLQELYNDLIKEQRNKDGKYFHLDAPSYGRKGFYSASIKTYIDFHKKTSTSTMDNAKSNTLLNQILYGPPGTGKTYSTINKSLFILNPKNNNDLDYENRTALKGKFEDYIKNEQIVFTTFHQSMSYEDFIEGIKPHTKNEQVTYAVEDGVFKSLVKKALTEYIRKDEHANETNSFDTLYNDFVDSIKPLAGKKEGTFTTKTGVDIMLVEANKTSIQVKYVWTNNKKEAEGQVTFTVSKEKLKKVLLEGIDPSKIKNLKTELHPLIGHIHCELFAVYKKFYDFVLANKGEIETVHFDYDDLSFEEVKEQFDSLSKEEISQKDVKPYIIIIDEINRGNVSQIFGELITLIEEDKRLGKDEALEVTLPYSKEKFGVPSNLYIIGTMNTADRSVEALDTALRRRFSFTEIMPKPELLEDILFKGFNLKEVLETINQRIELLLDRDHTIGHSYFMKVNSNDSFELLSVFKNCIIPLLQEYFYHDYEKIALILGQGFVRLKENNNIRFAFPDILGQPEIAKQFELIKEIKDIEMAVMMLLN